MGIKILAIPYDGNDLAHARSHKYIKKIKLPSGKYRYIYNTNKPIKENVSDIAKTAYRNTKASIKSSHERHKIQLAHAASVGRNAAVKVLNAYGDASRTLTTANYKANQNAANNVKKNAVNIYNTKIKQTPPNSNTKEEDKTTRRINLVKDIAETNFDYYMRQKYKTTKL